MFIKQKISEIITCNIILYILFVCENYIYQDWDCIKTWGKVMLYPFWIMGIIYATTYSIICFPLVLLHMELKKDKYQSHFQEMNTLVDNMMKDFLQDFNLIKK